MLYTPQYLEKVYIRYEGKKHLNRNWTAVKISFDWTVIRAWAWQDLIVSAGVNASTERLRKIFDRAVTVACSALLCESTLNDRVV